MLPQILQPSEYGTPVAAFSIDGLGICHFNRNSKAWEIAFLRDGHQLAVKVKEVDRDGKIIRDVTPNPIPINATSKHIRFFVNNASVAHFADFPQGQFRAAPAFSRSGDESFDFRWVVDFVGREVPNGDFRRFENSGVGLTIATIEKALFYTKRVTSDSVIVAPNASTDPEHDGRLLGRTNEVVGAAVYAAQPGTIHLEYAATASTPASEILTLPYVAGHLYEISLTNVDENKYEPVRALVGNYVKGDFQNFYKIIGVTGPNTYAIFAPPRSSLRSVDGDCHLGGLGGDCGGGDSLLPLIGP